MKLAVLTVAVAVMAMGMFATSASAKAHRGDRLTHAGTVASAGGGKLVMTGRNGKDHTHAVAKDAKITIDGKAGTLEGLHKGMHVSVTTDHSGNVMAISTVAVTPTAPAAATSTTATPAKATPAKTAPPATPAKSASK
jgi:hypothetical protein